MCTVPRPYPKEFRDDVVAVARRGDAPIKQVAADFGIAESCLRTADAKPGSDGWAMTSPWSHHRRGEQRLFISSGARRAMEVPDRPACRQGARSC